jgi:hypothetical protein
MTNSIIEISRQEVADEQMELEQVFEGMSVCDFEYFL